MKTRQYTYDKSNTVQAILRAVWARHPIGLTHTELVKETKLPKSTVTYYLKKFLDRRIIEKAKSGKYYRNYEPKLAKWILGELIEPTSLSKLANTILEIAPNLDIKDPLKVFTQTSKGEYVNPEDGNSVGEFRTTLEGYLESGLRPLGWVIKPKNKRGAWQTSDKGFSQLDKCFVCHKNFGFEQLILQTIHEEIKNPWESKEYLHHQHYGILIHAKCVKQTIKPPTVIDNETSSRAKGRFKSETEDMICSICGLPLSEKLLREWITDVDTTWNDFIMCLTDEERTGLIQKASDYAGTAFRQALNLEKDIIFMVNFPSNITHPTAIMEVDLEIGKVIQERIKYYNRKDVKELKSEKDDALVFSLNIKPLTLLFDVSEPNYIAIHQIFSDIQIRNKETGEFTKLKEMEEARCYRLYDDWTKKYEKRQKKTEQIISSLYTTDKEQIYGKLHPDIPYPNYTLDESYDPDLITQSKRAVPIDFSAVKKSGNNRYHPGCYQHAIEHDGLSFDEVSGIPDDEPKEEIGEKL